MAVSNQQSRDAALLRATTELFSLGTQHDADEIRRYEELATHFLGKVTAADRAFVAERLAKAKDAPPSVLRMLGKDLIEIASPILRRSDALSEIDLLSILSATGPAHHRQIATRAELPAPVVAALRLAGDAETAALLRRYPESPTVPVRRETSFSGEARPAISAPRVASGTPAAIPAARNDRDPEAREVFATARAMTAALSFEMASFATFPPAHEKDPKRELPEAAAGEVAAERIEPGEPEPAAAEAVEPAALQAEPAEPPASSLEAFLSLDARGRIDALSHLCGRVGPADPGMTILDADNAFRVALGSARVSQFARQHQRDALIQALANGLKLDVERVTAIADDPSGEALVVLLRAIGLSDAETHQVLLFANPAIAAAVETFFRLARLTGEVGRDAAERIAAGWRHDSAPRQPVHQPVFADMELRRTLRAEPSRPQQEDERGRRSAG